MAIIVERGIEIADVYATALLKLATEADRLDEVRAELDELVRLTEEYPAFYAFLTSTTVDGDARAKSLERIFRGRLSDTVLNTLQVMNQHGRAGLLPQLRRAYVLRLEDARGELEVTAISAVELDPEQKAQVAGLAEMLARRKPLVEYVVDPELIGGLVLQIGDYRFDSSIRSQLRAARAQLLERSRRGLGLGPAEAPPLGSDRPTAF